MADTVALSTILFHLSTAQVSWLVKRFTGCDNDREASEATEVPDRTLYRWKASEWFAQAYNQFTLVGAEIFRPLVEAIFESTAAIAAIEQRKLIETPNRDLDSRGIAAKSTAIGEVLDRAVPRRTVTEHTYIFKLSELTKIKQLEPHIIEGEMVAIPATEGEPIDGTQERTKELSQDQRAPEEGEEIDAST